MERKKDVDGKTEMNTKISIKPKDTKKEIEIERLKEERRTYHKLTSTRETAHR